MADDEHPTPGVRYLPDGRRTFEPGHTLSVRHGAYSAHPDRLVADRIDELVPLILDANPHVDAHADALAVRSLALAEAMTERLAGWIAEHGEFDAKGKLRPVVGELRAWAGRAERARARIGADPLSRASLAIAQFNARGLARGEALREHLESTYTDTDAEEAAE